MEVSLYNILDTVCIEKCNLHLNNQIMPRISLLLKASINYLWKFLFVDNFYEYLFIQ